MGRVLVNVELEGVVFAENNQGAGLYVTLATMLT